MCLERSKALKDSSDQAAFSTDPCIHLPYSTLASALIAAQVKLTKTSHLVSINFECYVVKMGVRSRKASSTISAERRVSQFLSFC